MTPETNQPDDPGLFGRAIGMITSPRATYEHVVRDPRPAIILLLVSAVIAVAAVIPQVTERGRQQILDTQVEFMERLGQPVTDEMYARLEEQSRGSIMPYVNAASTFVVMPVMALFFTALYWGIFNAVMGGTASFKQVLGIVTHSMVIMALGAAIALPIQLMQETWNPAGPFTLGALVPMLDPDTFIVRFLNWMSAITIWQIIVIAIGLGVLYKRKSTGIAITLILLYAAVVAVLVSVFSAFMGGSGS